MSFNYSLILALLAIGLKIGQFHSLGIQIQRQGSTLMRILLYIEVYLRPCKYCNLFRMPRNQKRGILNKCFKH